MITAKEIKVLDRNAEFHKIPPERLMESAGKGVADYVNNQIKPDSVLLFCGQGNNGGDGFVAARYLAKKYDVTVFLVGSEEHIRSAIARKNFKRLKTLPITIYDQHSIDKIPKLLTQSTLIIDAMLGIGLSGSLRSPFDAIVESINQRTDKIILSVDVPTGWGMNQAIKPAVTITFHDVKEQMNPENAGEIHILDIGIPHKAQQYVGPGDLIVHYPYPKKQSHKGENGRLLVIGGGPYSGAPALSALAALRTGIDLVFVATPTQTATVIAAYSPNIIVKPLPSLSMITKDDINPINELISTVDAVVLGPGLGSSYDTADAVRLLVPLIVKQNLPLVVDADGLRALGQQRDCIQDSNTIITPHAGEFTDFTGAKLPTNLKEKTNVVSQWAKKLGINIFLKGPIDILSNEETTKLNDVHNSAMTVGGTGDVLAGIIGAFLSKKIDSMNAMRMAAFLNGAAGNLVFQKKSYGLLATDIIEQIPVVLKRYL